MFKKIFLSVLLNFCFYTLVARAEDIPLLSAHISAVSDVEINKSIIFDASESSVSESMGQVTYEWFFGDGNRQQGVEVVHSYAEPGDYEVTLLIRSENGEQANAVHNVFVYKNSLLLITDVFAQKERINSFVESSKNENIFVDIIENFDGSSNFLSEESLEREISENISSLKSVDTILIWTNESVGLTVLSQLQRDILNLNFFNNKRIIFITENNFSAFVNIAKGVFETIMPINITLTRPEAIWVLLETDSILDFENILSDRAIQFEVVNDKLDFRIWNFMSYFTNSMVEKGVSSNTISLVLMLPVIVTVVAFMKQVVGVTTLGVYTPSILALSFIALDLEYGLIILFSILFFGMLTRFFLKKYRLLYIPRMAIVLSVVSLTILLLLYFGAIFNVSQVIGMAVFPMLIMSTLVEKFLTIQSEKGFRPAIFIIFEAVFVAVLAFMIAEWPWLKSTILGHPELILIFFGINVLLGRWTGLRVKEYIRFREVIRHVEEE